MARPKWTAERVAVLRGLVRQKLTGAQIAEHFGVGRSAVIAAINRECRVDPTFPRLQPWHGGRARTTKQDSPAGASSRSPENSPGRGTSSRPARGALDNGVGQREAPPSVLPDISPSRGEITRSAVEAHEMEDGAIGAVKGAARLPDAVGVEPPSSAAVTLSAASITLMELSAQSCRWPLAGPSGAGQRFCGCRRADGKPYCEPHVARARGAGSEGERAAARIGRAA